MNEQGFGQIHLRIRRWRPILAGMGNFRSVLLFLAVIPLAVVLGYQVASGTATGYALVALCIGLVSIPFLLRYYEPMFVLSVNSAFMFPFLPGQPELKILLGLFLIGMAILDRTINKKNRFYYSKNLLVCFCFLTFVVLGTAFARQGIGGRVFGGDIWGAGNYVDIFKAIIIFFAFSTMRIQPEKAGLYAALFFLGTCSHSLSNVVYALGADFMWLYYFVPTQSAALQHIGETSGYGGVVRLTGLAFSCIAVILYLLSRFGINGILNTWKFWRAIAFIGALVLSMYGGYRAVLILIALILVFQFYYEGLHRTAALPIYTAIFIISSILVIANIQKMPLSFQRSLSFLPVEIDSVAASDAAGTLDWRIQIWKTVVKDIPEYFWLGKGYSFRGADYQLTFEAVRKGIFSAYEHILIDGAYHHGLLTIIIPLGIWGIIAFVWFCVIAVKTIYRNYSHSPPELKSINTLILSYFSASLLFYCTLYGQFTLDFATFTSLLGFSVALNRTTREAEALAKKKEAESEDGELDEMESEAEDDEVRVPTYV